MKAIDEYRAEDAMTAPVKVISRDSSLDEAVRFLTDEGISGAPVLNHRDEPVGVISLFDIIAYIAGLERSLGKLGSFYFRSALRWDRASDSYSNLEGEDNLLIDSRVDDIMTPEIFSVARDTPLSEVMKELCVRGVHRLLVVEDKKVVGVVTTMDVMRVLTGQPRERAVAQS